MTLCRVTGTVVAPQKDPSFRESKLLVVRPIGLDGSLLPGIDQLALDPRFGAGIGDVVLVVREGGAVQQITGKKEIPANVVIVGIVDDWSVDGTTRSE